MIFFTVINVDALTGIGLTTVIDSLIVKTLQVQFCQIWYKSIIKLLMLNKYNKLSFKFNQSLVNCTITINVILLSNQFCLWVEIKLLYMYT